ncbi:MAG: substrate-binding domain-containing protein [Bryobacteraceae bacterium]|nr:substrate-binding domain-containing protein [Bryobacteraceae bacterium]
MFTQTAAACGVITLASAAMLMIAARPPAAAPSPERRAFRVCADPNNLPFSNDRGEGFENHIAELIASELGASVEYAWRAQRRGFIRNTLSAGACDVVLGAPAGYDPVLTSRPYYRSSYAFVKRRGRDPVRSFDDPRLRRMKIGVHLAGDDGANPPPAHALAARGIIDNVAGYTLYGDYSKPNPPARLIEAVAKGDIDVAIAWGPIAGYFAARQPVALEVTPIEGDDRLPHLPFVYEISLGVRKSAKALRAELEHILDKRQADIDEILAEFDVPAATAER